jgi:uncharacterized protein YecT (DUF1311 family)
MEGDSGGNKFSGAAGIIAGLAALITAATGAWVAFTGTVHHDAPAAAEATIPPTSTAPAAAATAAALMATQPPPAAVAPAQTAVAVATPQSAPVATTAELPAAPAPTAVQPGFDCLRAANHVEVMICDNATLATQDRELMQLYRQDMAAANAGGWSTTLRTSQRQWLKARNACDGYDCVARAYAVRIGQLQGSL